MEYFLKNPQVLGLSSLGVVIIAFGFYQCFEKINSIKNELKEFKVFQEKKCGDHKNEGQKSFDKLEKRIEEGFKTLFDRIEAQTQFFVNLVKK